MLRRIGMLIMILALFLGGCGSEDSFSSLPITQYRDVAMTDLSAEIGGLATLGMTEKEVRTLRGEPIMEGETSLGEIVLDYADYQYTFENGELRGYSLKEETLTAEKVGIGDSRDYVIEAYGDRYLEREEGELRIIGYADQDNQRILEFLLKDERVEVVLFFSTDGQL